MPTDTALDAALGLLQKHWGHPRFRQSQRIVIEAALAGEDVLAVLPTGYGKSACFQIPALCKEGCAIVISPLIALMKDQVDDCHARGIPASYVNSHVDQDDIEERLDDLIGGAYKVFYVAPERIRNKYFLTAVRRADINFIVVDEAHCASRWGHDFRPMYSRIRELVELISGDDGVRPPIIAVTATATRDIEDDIAESVGMVEGYTRIVADPIRPNLRYIVKHGNPWSNLGSLIDTFEPREGRYIVYVGTRNGAEKVAEIISNQLNPALVGFYHAGMAKEEREATQDAFKDGGKPIIVATCAFGMGIDVPNIRSVIHFGIPGSLEDYIQEAGRAGRDGKDSDVVLLFDQFSVKLRQMFLDGSNPPYELYLDVWKWLHAKLCNGETLSMSAKNISTAMSAFFRRNVNDRGVNGVLNTMESYGLVKRRYMRGGTTVRFMPHDFRRMVDGGEHSPNTRSVIEAIWAEVDADMNGVMEITFDREVFAKQCGIGQLSLMRALKSLQTFGAIKILPAFGGKTATITDKHYGADVNDILPGDEIKEKRDREVRRLRKMIGYADVSDPIQYIRDYFMKGV